LAARAVKLLQAASLTAALVALAPVKLASGVEIEHVAVGIAGAYKPGYWVPVTVKLSGTDAHRGRLVVTVPDSEAVPCQYWPADGVGATRDGYVTRYVRFARPQSGLMVAFRSDAGGAPVTRRLTGDELPDAVGTLQRLVLALGCPIGLEPAVVSHAHRPSESVIERAIDDPRQLPTSWYGYDCVDLLFFSANDADAVHSLSDAQVDAIEQWIQMGGRMVIAVGRHADRWIGNSAPLARFLPGTYEGIEPRRVTTNLEAYAGTRHRFALPEADAAGHIRGIPSARIRAGTGQVLAADQHARQSVPWILRAPYGLGMITWVTFDVNDAQSREWAGRGRLVARLVTDALAGHHDDVPEADRGEVSHLGFTDLSGQLRMALDQFPSVDLVPFWVILVLAAGYVLLIGPGDFFFLRRALGRMTFTWLTFPLLVAGACALCFWLAQTWKGQTMCVNRVDLVDLDASANVMRGTSWLHVYSPRIARFRLAVEPVHGSSQGVQPTPPGDSHHGRGTIREQGVLLGWQGQPGSGFGGLEARTAPRSYLGPYRSVDEGRNGSPSLRIEDLVIPSWSSRSLVATWWDGWNDVCRSNLWTSTDRLLRGEVTYPLAVPARECAVCFGRWYYELGEMEPGESFRLEGATPLDLQSRLTGRRIVEAKQVSSPWQKEGLEITRIIELMMFHDAAGGRKYTDLLHRYSARLDMTDQLVAGRAVLLGRMLAPATRLELDALPDGQLSERRWSFFRIVLPVEEREG
jgi:hypothetical protein